jgi:subtilisin family serine protease
MGIRGAAPGVLAIPLEADEPLQAAWAVLRAVRRGARVLNLSWDCAAHPALRSALLAASAAGCVVVLAVPNDARDFDREPTFPLSCAFPGMLAVMACHTLAPNAALAVSARGARTVHLAAPGDSLLTTVAPPAHGFVEGTSASAALASAAAALVLRCAPWLGGREVVALLVATARRTPALDGACVSGGVLDAEAAVRAVLKLRCPSRGH